MSRVIQFFSEFTKLNKNDIIDLDRQINEEDIYKLSINDISDITQNLQITKEKLSKYQNSFKKLEEINQKEDIKFITFADSEFPESLNNILQAPKILYYKGDISLLNYPRNIGVIGSRKPTAYGKWTTHSIVKELVHNNFCIVSGFANGIDSVSHKTAVENNGRTIGVFGTPVNVIYPKNNKKLLDEVLSTNGLVISEINALKKTLPYYFALRNRIISGISSGVLLTEAGAKSGSLITANYALNQGKHIFAVPGNINSQNSIGTNSLIKDGACMVTSVNDILNEYGYTYEKLDVKKMKEDEDISDLSDVEMTIYKEVKSAGSCHAEKIAMDTCLKIQDIISILNILDIKGYITYDGFMANYIMK